MTDRRFGLTVAALGIFFVTVFVLTFLLAIRTENKPALLLVGTHGPLAGVLVVIGARIATDAEGAA